MIPAPRPVASPDKVEPVAIRNARIGGVTIEGEAFVRPVMQTEAMQVMHLELKKGYLHPLHSHADNESTGIVISGLLEMRIGDDVYRLGPNDTWFHPRGVLHQTQALEDTVAFEIHSPHRDDYRPYF